MNRRHLFKALVGFGALGAASTAATASTKKYGCLTIAGHRHHLNTTGEMLRVYLDGVEVLKCYEADDIEGYALTMCVDEKDHRDWGTPGRIHIRGDGNVCRMRLTGNIVIKPGPK